MMNEKQKLRESRDLFNNLYQKMKETLGFTEDPKITFIHSEENAKNPLGRTGFYIPESRKIGIYITGRHVKDIMRSLAHEIVHHSQACRGEFDNANPTTEGYAQQDEHLREMEAEAYLAGNLAFRDWSDEYVREQNEKGINGNEEM